MQKIKTVFFDIDNTLLSFDEYVKQSMKEGFAHFGLKPYEAYMYNVFTQENNKLWRMLEQGALSFEELEKIRWNRIFQVLGISFDGVIFEAYFRSALFESAIPEEGAYEVLAYLKKNYILCAASNGPYEQQIHRLEKADMKKYFDHIFVSEKVGVSKPSKEFFDCAFEEINRNRKDIIMPQETMIIGDSLSADIEGGRRYGMEVCLYRRNKEMTVPDGVYTVDDLRQVMEYL